MTGMELYKELLRICGNRISSEEREILEERMARLTEPQTEVLVLRLGLGDGKRLTLEETAERMGISLERVRLLENAVVRKLRAPKKSI